MNLGVINNLKYISLKNFQTIIKVICYYSLVELLTEYADAVVTENTSSIATDNINLLVVNISDKGDRDFTYKPTLSDNKTEEVSAILKYIVKFMLRFIDSMSGAVTLVIINGLKLSNQKDFSYNVPHSMIKLVYLIISI